MQRRKDAGLVDEHILVAVLTDGACLEELMIWEGAWPLFGKQELGAFQNGQHILGQLDHHTAIMAEPMEAAGNSRRRGVEAGIQVYAAVIVHQDAGVKGELIVLASSPDYPVVIVHMAMEYAFVAQLHPS